METGSDRRLCAPVHFVRQCPLPDWWPGASQQHVSLPSLPGPGRSVAPGSALHCMTLDGRGAWWRRGACSSWSFPGTLLFSRSLLEATLGVGRVGPGVWGGLQAVTAGGSGQSGIMPVASSAALLEGMQWIGVISNLVFRSSFCHKTELYHTSPKRGKWHFSSLSL